MSTLTLNPEREREREREGNTLRPTCTCNQPRYRQLEPNLTHTQSSSHVNITGCNGSKV